MSVILIDTNVVSYMMRGHTLADAYRPILTRYVGALSFMTVAELYQGALSAGWGERRLALLEDQLSEYEIFSYTPEICRVWAEVRAARRRRPISAEDAWVAATALVHSCPLVTHDAADFGGIAGLKVITAAAE
ncbi:MAG TPA: PIN domain-containing protein [Phycisphaerae bacterium]|nr:PIN domain-containing protein [Phycisphaerae bacterium]